MTGGSGKDTFYFGHGGEADMITDFRDYGDQVVFANTIDSLGIEVLENSLKIYEGDIAPGLSGLIRLTKALPEIDASVIINGLASDQSQPTIQLDFAGNAGIRFAAGSDGSLLIGRSLVSASEVGLAHESSIHTIQNNGIGVDLDGLRAMANDGNGITITASSTVT